jgi:hypothetical protein
MESMIELINNIHGTHNTKYTELINLITMQFKGNERAELLYLLIEKHKEAVSIEAKKETVKNILCIIKDNYFFS